MKSISSVIMVLSVTLMMVSLSWAKDKDDEKPNDCGRLHVQIGNATSQPCQLIKTTLNHGKLVTSPPAVILPGYTERFDLTQTYYGPDIILEYQCQGHSLKFESQQNYCFLKAGQVSGVLYSIDPKLRASFTTENGSYYWSKPGLISWIINSN